MALDHSGFEYASLAGLEAQLAEGFEPVRRLSVLDAISENVRVPQGIGMDGVPFDWMRVPYLRGVAEAFASPDYEMVALMGGAQITGKTGLLQALALGYCGAVRRCDAKIVHFSQAQGRTFSQEKLDRMIRASPALRNLLDLAPGQDNVFDKTWLSGAMLRIIWPTVENLSGSSTPFMLMTDRDRMDDTTLGASAGDGKKASEGAPEQLALNRIRAFGDEGCVLVESTPGRDNPDPNWRAEPGAHAMPPVGGIGGIYNSGDRRRYYVPCPHCETAFEPTFETLHPGRDGDLLTRAAATVMVCPNGCVIEQHSKMWMNRRGAHVPEGMEATVGHDVLLHGQVMDRAVVAIGTPSRRTGVASFHIPATMASAERFPWSELIRLNELAEEEFRASGSEEGRRDFALTKLALPYTPQVVIDRKPMSVEVLRARSRAQARRTVPGFVRFLVAAVDVQKDRFVVQVHGVGPGLEMAVIDRFDVRESVLGDEDGKPLRIAPGERAEDWSQLTEWVVKRAYRLEDDSGRRMRVALTCCDMHGVPGVSTNATAYARTMIRNGLGRRFALLRGDPLARRSVPIRKTFPDTSRRSDRKGATAGDVPVWQLNTNAWKDVVARMLGRDEPGPGYLHVPGWLGDWFFRELTAESRGEDGVWSVPTGGSKRNEALDLLCYARAMLAASAMNVERADWAKTTRPLLQPQDDNPNVFLPGPDQTGPQKPSRASVWGKVGEALASAG